MATASGISAQFGFKAETTYGTAVTVDRFQPFMEESIETTPEFLENAGIIASQRVLNSTQWTHGVVRHGGDLGLELTTRNCGVLLQHCLGSLSTSSLAGTSTHTITPGDLTGKGLTIQIGRPDSGGTVRPFTYAGTKVASWEIALSANENATFGLSVVSQTMTTLTALASASYTTTSNPFSFASGSFTLAGSTLCIRSARVAGDNKLDADRVCVGHNYIEEPIESDLRELTGELEMEFPDLVHYNRFLAGTEGYMSLGLVNGTKSLTLAGNVRTDKSAPQVSGRGVILQTFNFKCVASTASDASAFTATYVTADTTP